MLRVLIGEGSVWETVPYSGWTAAEAKLAV